MESLDLQTVSGEPGAEGVLDPCEKISSPVLNPPVDASDREKRLSEVLRIFCL